MIREIYIKIIIIIVILIGIIETSIGFLIVFDLLNKKKSYMNIEVENISKTTTNGVESKNVLISSTEHKIIISNIFALFSKSSQSVSYSFYSINKGKYDIYLKKVLFSNNKKCNYNKNNKIKNISNICNSIILSLEIGTGNSKLIFSSSNNNIINHKLSIGYGEPIVISIKNNDLLDRYFNVYYGDIILIYDYK